VVRDGAVIAWRVPDGWRPEHGVRIVGSHTDSPALKLKPNPVISSAGWQQLGVEVYGGPLLGTWLDRELGLAGRLVTRDGDVHLVSTGPILRVPHLAPHLDRTLGDHVQLDRQRHLQPVYAIGEGPDPYQLLLAAAGIPDAELASYDVFCYPTEPSAVFGAQDEFFASWRLDNLSSVHASLTAFLEDGSVGESLAVFAAFDHEEVGSSTRSGASGPFLADVHRGPRPRRVRAPASPGGVELCLCRRGARGASELPRAPRPGEPAAAQPRTAPQAQRLAAVRVGRGGVVPLVQVVPRGRRTHSGVRLEQRRALRQHDRAAHRDQAGHRHRRCRDPLAEHALGA